MCTRVLRCSRAAATRAPTPVALTAQAVCAGPPAVSAASTLVWAAALMITAYGEKSKSASDCGSARSSSIPADGDGVGQCRGQGPAQLPVRPDDQGRAGRHRGHLGQPRMGLIGGGQLGLVERDRPVDGHGLVGQVEEGVGVLGRQAPMVVDQVGVGGFVLQGLEGVAHAAGHVDRGLRPHLEGERPAEMITGSQVHPGPEDPPLGQRDQLVPGLGVDAPGRSGAGVERHVVLHRTEVRQAEPDHLGPLPVLLEPAPVVPAYVQVDHQQPGDVGRASRQPSATAPGCEYLASVSAFCGRHHASLAWYHLIVSARPDSKSE